MIIIRIIDEDDDDGGGCVDDGEVSCDVSTK